MQYTLNKSDLKEILNIKQYTDTQLETYIFENYKGVRKVSITDDEIILEISDENVSEKKFNKLIKLSENGKYQEAIQLAKEILDQSPSNSEVNRILGQIYFIQGKLTEAEEYTINALKWSPSNYHAITLMGNILYKAKNTDTALLYWNQALKHNSDDYVSLTNIGSTLCKENSVNEGISFIEEALKIDKKYSNALYSLALAYYMKNEYDKAFKFVIDALKNTKEKNLVKNAFNLCIDVAKKLSDKNNNQIEKLLKQTILKLQNESKKEIKIEHDPNIDTDAKLIIAEYHNNDFHKLVYKNSSPILPHLLIHELMHLKYILEARSKGENKLFVSSNSCYEKFKLDLEKDFLKLKKEHGKEIAEKVFESIFNGLNSQIYNSPIDLFIEDKIYNEYPLMRPIQFLSLHKLLNDAVKANTQKDIIKITPSKVLSVSKKLNLVFAMHFKELFGIDITSKFNSKKNQLNEAKAFFNEFKEYVLDKEPGEEYELINHWSEDLKVDYMFNLKPEDSITSEKNIDIVIQDLIHDPYGIESEDKTKLRSMLKFIESHQKDGINMAVVFHMSSAINYYKNMSKEKIKKIAFEFATLGMSGIDPKKGNYEIPSINKKFSGYKALAFYYVAWALSIPEMLSQLQMPFDEEYKLARKFA